MSSNIGKLAQDLQQILDNKNRRKTSPYDTSAEVVRVDSDTLWVHIPGGVDETPIKKTVDAHVGDSVQVHIENGGAWAVGNATRPPTDDAKANYAVDIAYEANAKVIGVEKYVTNELTAQKATIGELEADAAKIHDLTADELTATVGYISDLTAGNISASDIVSDHATIEDLDVQSLSAATAYIGALTTGNVTAQNIIADHGTVGSLNANYAHISNGVIDNATIGYADVNGLSANYASINALTAATGRIDSLEANEAVINDTLTATNAHVEYLESDWISTDRLVLTGNNKNNYPPVEITESEFNVNKTAYYTKNGDTYTQCTSSSVYNPNTQYYVKQSVKAIIEAINNANRYTEASPTQAQFNANKTNYYTYNGAEYIQCKSTDTYSSSTQYYIYDTQIVVSKDKLIAASMDVAELSAITADMGTLTAGKIQKGNNYINLNTLPASLEFKNASTWSGATQGIKFDTQGNLAIKGTVDITSSNTIYNKTEVDEALGDKADADDVYTKSDFSITPQQIVSKVTATEAKLAGAYATSSTGSSTATKVATLTPAISDASTWTLTTGTTVTVKFTYANTATTPSLNIKRNSSDTNGTGAKTIKTYNGVALEEKDYKWSAGDTLTFLYDGSSWLMQEASARMKTAETKIEQTATNVLIKATETDTTAAQGGQHLIQSLINVAPSGVTISADKVNIEGATIFTNGRLSETSLDNAYEEHGAVADLVTDLASASGTTVINGGHIDTGSISIGQVYELGDSLEDAANTASSYIADIDSQNGITIKAVNGETDVTAPAAKQNYIKLNANDGMQVYKDGVSVAKYSNTARVGPDGKGRVEIAPSGIDMYGYNANAETPTELLAHIGFDYGKTADDDDTTAIAPYYTFGKRSSGSAIGNYSFAEGVDSVATGWCSHSEGYGCGANQTGAHAEGISTMAARASHAEGESTSAIDRGHAEGFHTIALGTASHAEGFGKSITVDSLTVESIIASGNGSHVEGYARTGDYQIGATGLGAHAEGTTSEGGGIRASGDGSHAEGGGTTASGACAHAEGRETTASGDYSHAEGRETTASGDYSHAEGLGTQALSANQTVIGKYNIADDQGVYLFIIGHGTSTTPRNAFAVDTNGYIYPNSTKMLDFVTAYGNKDYWRYRKWMSGKIEAWYMASVTASATTATGNIYRSTYSLSIPSDIGFTNAPNIIISINQNASTVFAINGRASSKTAISGYIFRSGQSTDTYTLNVSVYAWQL